MPLYQCKHRIDTEGNIVLTLELGSGSYASTFLEELDKAIEHLKPKKYFNKPKARVEATDTEHYDAWSHKSVSTKLKQDHLNYKLSKIKKNHKEYDPTAHKKPTTRTDRISPKSQSSVIRQDNNKADTRSFADRPKHAAPRREWSRPWEVVRRREFDDSSAWASYRSYDSSSRKLSSQKSTHVTRSPIDSLSPKVSERTYSRPSTSTYQKKVTPGFYNKGTKKIRAQEKKEWSWSKKVSSYTSEPWVTIIK